MADTGMSGGAGGGPDEVPTLEDSISASLEKQKFRLLTQVARDKKTKNELEGRIAEADERILEAKHRLGEYNALFMSIDDAATKAPRQRLGAAQAVMGTKRIIERELNKLFKDAAVTEMKLNKQKDKNGHSKGHVDQLRKEHVTFRKLFVSMTDELSAVKGRIGATKKAVNDSYAQRDRAQEDMRELARQFEMDKLERQAEWGLFTEAIDRANKEGLPDNLEGGSGLLTQEQEEQLRQKIRKGQQKMAKDRAALSLAQQKLAAYVEALQHIKAATGYDAVDDIVSTFDKYEDEKFQKVQAANRMVEDIEALEKQVAATRTEVQQSDAGSAALKLARLEEREALEKEAAELDAHVEDTQASVVRMLEEVRSLYPVVEFAFHATGCDFAFDAPGGSPDGGATTRSGGSSSPMRSKTASLKMYTGNQSTRAEVRAGVSAGSLAAFMGIMESHAADLIQQYAAMISTGGLGGGDGPGDMTRRFLSPSALGPSKPSGKLKESVTSSALIAALAVDTVRMDGSSVEDGAFGDEEPGRPMTLEELKKQAAAQITGDKNFKLMRSAASTAANVLTRVGVMQA